MSQCQCMNGKRERFVYNHLKKNKMVNEMRKKRFIAAGKTYQQNQQMFDFYSPRVKTHMLRGVNFMY